jgi:hypothetical protein
MRDLTRHIAHARHCKVLLALLLVLALAFAADRLAASYGPLGSGGPTAGGAGLTAAEPPIPAELPENMAGGGKPVGESSDCLLVPFVLKPGNGNGRIRPQAALKVGSWTCVTRRYAAVSLCPTASLIASDLGRQFTLVGARPSGTS